MASGLGSGAILGIEGVGWGNLSALLAAENTTPGQAKLGQSDKLDSLTPSGSSIVLCQSGKMVGTNMVIRPATILRKHLWILPQDPVSNCNKLAIDD